MDIQLQAALLEGAVILGGILLAEGIRRANDRRSTVRHIYADLQEATSLCSIALHRAARSDDGTVRERAVKTTYDLGRLLTKLDDACGGRGSRNRRIREASAQLRKRMVLAKGEVLMRHRPGRDVTDLDAGPLLRAIDGVPDQ